MTIDSRQPLLTGIRVIDLTTVVFGPYATQTLADLGAEVVKIEPPEGDGFRYAGKPAVTKGMGPGHMTLNRGKRSVVLDLKDDDDREAMRALLKSADVFIHNVRARAIDKLGFGYEAVKALKPDIVYVHCVGFGSDGPYADLQAYDDVIQAASGAASLASRVDGDPRPRYIPSLVADKIAGLHGAYATLAAIIHRLRTGEGQRVEVPMFEAFTHFMLKEHLFGATFDPPVGAVGYPRQLDPNRQPFPTLDGWISIVPYTDESLKILFEVLERPDVLRQEPYATPGGRWGKISEIYAIIAGLTPSRTTADWMERCAAARLPAMAVRDLADMLDDPHLRKTGFFTRRTHPTEGDFWEMAPPVNFGAAALPAPTLARRVGEDTEEIKAGLKP
jgi:crotonobetainyl-CoA:carnitine CoA-transferase CaiB-like acyl-CoA transferase